ncbi:BTAD domain-containing putative transcriptional regulator [Saccharothrix violaceirubra]|uniref:DNA-binding SARP family transcriptional activator n=1 Tax=Saccharothrix violaceirubra TaxID=413306 RepID=A0A7W7T4E9_9PSEU|nr:BTAD domain-containing putative transcriptional regulator [Saccharothrix violaceirubra]MBB4966322.1 DNA-binding SARP family transcriptional activator [Saccharothrix violaceirubra]
MEVLIDGKPTPLGGAKQRATLAFLLMNPNRVVATSKLLKALWTDDMPKSARKILQNAVWGLRSLLTTDREGSAAALVTQPPGYLLQLDPEKIDMHVFLRLAKQGRAALATDPEAASRLLREALTLWQGPPLADLVETGVSWPELTSLQNTRLDAMEDYFEAELARGRHQAAIDELELMVESEPLRERSCGQLMLALYRSGRQADALRVYGRVRAALVGELGLEPGRELQKLQSAILSHDPGLAAVAPAPTAPEPRAATTVRRHAGGTGVAMIKVQPTGTHRDHPLLDLVARVTGEEVERFGGRVTASIGSVSLALFDQDGTGETGELRAVRAAAAITGRLPDDDRHALTFQAAVSAGSASAGQSGVRPVGTVAVSRATLADCENLLAHVPDGEIWVSERVHRSTGSAVAYQRVTEAWVPAWRVLDADPFHRHGDLSCDRRGHELGLLTGLLDLVRVRDQPHLVTLVGAPDTGKSRLVADFERLIAENRTADLLRTPIPADVAGDGIRAVQSRIVDVHCGAELGRPLVILIDDLHRASDALLDRVDDLVDCRRDLPLLVIGTTRPSLLDRRPEWGLGKHNATTITLSPPRVGGLPGRTAACVGHDRRLVRPDQAVPCPA